MSSREAIVRGDVSPTTAHPAGVTEPDDSVVSPKYIWIGVGVLTIVTLSVLAVVLFIRLRSPAHDPFSEYSDIVPGQTRSVVMAKGFACQPYASQYCTKSPRKGSFALITVTLSNDIVQHVKFIPRESTFTVGELALLLGERPHVIRYRKSITLKWVDAGITAFGWAERKTIGYDLSVQSVELALL